MREVLHGEEAGAVKRRLEMYLANLGIIAVAFLAFDALSPHGTLGVAAGKCLLVLAGLACAWVNREIREAYGDTLPKSARRP